MTVDIPRAWQIARSRPKGDHHPKCSYRTYGLICDCWVLKHHPDFIDDEMQTAITHEEKEPEGGSDIATKTPLV